MTALLTIWKTITQRGPVVWFRNLFYIVGNYRNDLTMICNGVDECREVAMTAQRYIKRATKVHVDVDPTSAGFTQVVVIGRYRGKDHVQIFSLRPDSIDMLIEQLREMQRYCEVGRIEAPLDINATMKRSLII